MNIVIPMDFTAVAMNAFKYAHELFKNESLHVVHVTSPSGQNPEAIGLKAGQTKSSILKKELSKLIRFELEYKKLPDNISIEILKGEVNPSIRKYVRENDFDFMVMGTRDKYSLFDKWLGTISLGLIKTIDLPIYLVPRFSKFKGFNRVLVACDQHVKEGMVLQNIVSWNKPHTAFFNFLHVETSENDNYEDVQRTIVQELFEENNVNFAFEIESIKSKDISKSLLASAYNSGSDLMIVLPDNQSFLNSIIVNSISKELILKTDIPLLFFGKSRINPNYSTNTKVLENKEN